jgi:hypothetical protein
MISKLFIGDPRSLEQYRQEMLDGILDFEVERGNWEYTYHLRMRDQIPWIIGELRRNPDSRRAVVSIRSEEDMRTGSPACLQNIHYLLRDGKMHCKVLFRSNDATKAAYMNAFALFMLQKRIAETLGVPSGRTLTAQQLSRLRARLRHVRRLCTAHRVRRGRLLQLRGRLGRAHGGVETGIAEMVRQLREKG